MRRGIAVVVIVLVASVIAWADAKLKVPDLRGKSLAEANQALKQAGFMFDVAPGLGCDADDAKHGNDKIRCQDPSAGALADKHALVHIGIQQDFDDSGLIRAKDLATLIGLTVDEAKHKLHDLGYKGDIQVAGYDGHDPCKSKTVCKTEPDRDLYKNPGADYALILYVAR